MSSKRDKAVNIRAHKYDLIEWDRSEEKEKARLVGQDAKFRAAMRAAVASGKEHVQESEQEDNQPY